MSADAAKIWRVIVAAQLRRQQRAKDELEAARQDMLAAEAAHAAAAAETAQACERRRIHESGLKELLSASLSAALYLSHDAWRGHLRGEVQVMQARERQAHDAIEKQERKVAVVRTKLARIDVALDKCRLKLKQIEDDTRRRREETADEEAIESLLARRALR
ncbi:hypothetical protein [Collimonas pratensis]|uniref:Bacterial type III secretion family protein n=1 Tax=Collimonas pratensis TaxID=279113 RepID=A0A127QAA9_9BURK|nr:hypothetical protein [Collimonas pratensis]AMP06999.1 bacterial type III secretion family protein [Collimonas pratensis]